LSTKIIKKIRLRLNSQHGGSFRNQGGLQKGLDAPSDESLGAIGPQRESLY
jgi:hypothetical protein